MRVSRALARMREALRGDEILGEIDELAVTGRHPRRRPRVDLEDASFADEQVSASGSVDLDIDDGPTGVRDAHYQIAQLLEPAAIPTLREEVSTQLWGRLGSLAAAL